MSEKVKYAEIKLNDIFNFTRGNIISKKYIRDNEGIYPVYSSQTKDEGVLGYINTYMFDTEGITWTTDGVNAGTTFVRRGKFNITNVCGLMTLKKDISNIFLDYIDCIIDLKRISKTDGNRKVMIDTILRADLSVNIPIDHDGNFDIEKQRELAEKYKIIEEQKHILLAEAKELEKISVLFPQGKDVVKKELKDIFISISRGKSKYTKTFCKENPGEYPLYSADNEKPLGKMNCYDYEGEYLTISINGIAGKISILNGCFSTNADRVVCVPKENIDIRYVKYVAEPILRDKAKGRLGDLGKNEFTKLTPDMIKIQSIPIPVKEDGSYDIEKQRELAGKYEQIEEIKQYLIEKIIELTEIVVV